MTVVVIILIALALVALYFAKVAFGSYNDLQTLTQEMGEAKSNVQIALSKKLSLINQLIDVVKSYGGYETANIGAVLRTSPAAGLVGAYQQSGTAMMMVQGVADRFPNLKANEQYHQLVTSIHQCETEIQSFRQALNSVVKRYNTLCLSMPVVFVSRRMGFRPASFLEFDTSGLEQPRKLQTIGSEGSRRVEAVGPGQSGNMLSSGSRESATTPYFYRMVDGTPRGPASLADLRQLYLQGSLDASTMVKKEGSEEWRPIATLLPPS